LLAGFRLGFFDNQAMDTVGRLRRVLGFKAENAVAVVLERTGDVFNGFAALKADFGSLSRLHAFDKKFCFDESKWADFIGNIDIEVRLVALIVFHGVIHCSYLPGMNMFII